MKSMMRLELDVRRSIDEHLDAVEEALRGNGLSRGERQNILDDVQTQLLDMLAARVPHGEPTLADVRAVIDGLDRPESYAAGEGNGVVLPRAEPAIPAAKRTAGAAPMPSRISMLAVLSSLLAVLGLCLQLVIFFSTHAIQLLMPFLNGGRPAPPWGLSISEMDLFYIGFMILGILVFAFMLGWVALSQIRHSSGKLYGRGLAVVGLAGFPLFSMAMLILLGMELFVYY